MSIHHQHHNACTSHERSKCRIAKTLLCDVGGGHVEGKKTAKDKHFESVDSEQIPKTKPFSKP